MLTENNYITEPNASAPGFVPVAAASPSDAKETTNLFNYWPMAVGLLGGLVGLSLGGLATVVNLQIMKSDLPVAVKYLLAVLSGAAATAFYFAIVLVVL